MTTTEASSVAELDMADLNEFHWLSDGKAYRAWSPVCIVRVTYGTSHVDVKFSDNVDQMNVGGVVCRGFYAYVVAGVDPYAQGVFFAQRLLAKIGHLSPSDFVSWDIEEGSGDQSARAGMFMQGVHSVLKENPAQDFGYSGQSFWLAHLGTNDTVDGIAHRWVAAYGQTNPPPLGEALWQFTDSAVVPGVVGRCDCSKYMGTLAQFQALIGDTSDPLQPQGDEVFVAGCSHPKGGGFWMAKADGSVFTFPDKTSPTPAVYHGGANGTKLAQPIYAMAATATGNGYWLFAEDGGVFNYGDAKYLGSAAQFALVESPPPEDVEAHTITLEPKEKS